MLRRVPGLLLGALVSGGLLAATSAGAADYGVPLPVTVWPQPVIEAPVWYGPSPFAVSGSAYGLSGYGYYYDEPTEHRLGPPPGAHYRRVTELRRRVRR